MAIIHFDSLTDMRRAYKVLKEHGYKPRQIGTLFLMDVDEPNMEQEYVKIKKLLAQEEIEPLWIESENQKEGNHIRRKEKELRRLARQITKTV